MRTISYTPLADAAQKLFLVPFVSFVLYLAIQDWHHYPSPMDRAETDPTHPNKRLDSDKGKKEISSRFRPPTQANLYTDTERLGQQHTSYPESPDNFPVLSNFAEQM